MMEQGDEVNVLFFLYNLVESRKRGRSLVDIQTEV